jgi:hypothetical protein
MLIRNCRAVVQGVYWCLRYNVIVKERTSERLGHTRIHDEEGALFHARCLPITISLFHISASSSPHAITT